MTNGPTHGSAELLSDGYRLLGVLALETQSTDHSSDTALRAHYDVMLRDLGWHRSAMAYELLAGTALATAMALARDLEPPEDRLHLEAGLVDQPAVNAMLFERVQGNRWSPGEVTAELADGYRHDPEGLAWVMFTAAATCCARLSAHAARQRGELDRFGEGDEEPQGISRQTVDWLTSSLQQVEEDGRPN